MKHEWQELTGGSKAVLPFPAMILSRLAVFPSCLQHFLDSTRFVTFFLDNSLKKQCVVFPFCLQIH